MDLYSVNFQASNKLYINNGPSQAFTDATTTYGIADGTTAHWSSAWIDIDNDGDLDLYSVNNSASNKLYINNGPNQVFTDATTTYGVADGTTKHYTSSWVDIDNDGDLDLYSLNYGASNKLFINNGPNQVFTDATATYGITDGTTSHLSSSWIDIDNDGDLDLYSVNVGASNNIYINPGQGGQYLKVMVNDSNGKYQYNSRVEIDRDGNNDFSSSGNLLVQYQSNSSYGGTNQYYVSQDPVGLYFGLGSDSTCKYDVRIFLPNVSPSSTPSYSFTDVCPGQTLTTGVLSLTLDSFAPFTNNQTPVLSGTATTTKNTIASVDFQLGSTSGSWSSCSAQDGVFNGTSEAFSCQLPTLLEAGYFIYFRARDSIGTSSVLTASVNATSRGVLTIDTTSPQANYANTDGVSRTFTSLNPVNNFFTTNRLPQFQFVKSADSLSGIAKYQILIKKEGGDYLAYLDNLSDEPSAGTILDEEKRYVSYSGETITVYAKGTDQELSDGAYLWKVKAYDFAGNTKDSEERMLLINTRQAIFSSPQTFFPLTLLNIGGTNVNFTSLDLKSTPESFKINNPLPTFYGISTVNSKITLTIKRLKEVKGESEENRGTLEETYGESEEIFKGETIANQESRFGISPNQPLTSGDYLINLSASQNFDYVELPEFTLIIGSTVNSTSEVLADFTSEVSESEVIQPTPQPKDSTLSPTGSLAPPAFGEAPLEMTGNVNFFQKILQFFKKIF